MALAIDGSTPAVVTNTSTTVATITTASFTPPAGALLLVLWAGDTQGAVTPGAPSITDNLGAHLTYTLVDHRLLTDSPGSVDGQAAIWWAVVGSSSAMTVTVTSGTASGARESALKVMVITGQHATPIGAHGKAGSKSAASIAQNFTGTASGSWGFVAVCDWDLKGAETAGTGCTVINSANVASAITYGFLRRTSADGTNGGTTTLNVTIPTTSTNLCWCYVEVVPAAAAAAVYPPASTTNRRRPQPVRRARLQPTPVPAQVAAAPAPAKVPDLARRVQRAGWRRSKSTGVPVERTSVPQQPARRRVGVWRRRPAAPTPVPVQVVPAAPAYPAGPVRPRRMLVPRRRPAVPPLVPDQTPPPPQSRSRRGVLPRRRPAVPGPVPAQVSTPAPPANPGWWLRSRRVSQVRRHSAAPMPVPDQVIPPPPPALPLWVVRPHRVVTGLRRGRAVTPVPPQAAAPAAPVFVPQLRTARRVMTAIRRRPAPVPPPVQERPPAPVTRRVLRVLTRHRQVPAPVPAQVVVVPPVYPRQPIRHRVLDLLLRRPGRLRFPEQPGAAVIGATEGIARPGDGQTLRAGPGAGTTPAQARPGDGSTTTARGG